MKKIAEHTDLLGKTININDCVAFSHSNRMFIGKVRKLNPKMIGIDYVKYRGSCNKYPNDIVVVEGADVTMYILKNV